MALKLADRVKETSITTGTSDYALAGAETGFETFLLGIGNSNTTYYCCTDGTDFEIGLGTYTSATNTLGRTTILQSSNSDAAVSWSAGTRILFCTYPADKSVFLDADGQVVINGTSVTSTATELNILDGVTASATDINLIDGITNGTVIASKAIVTDANKDITGGRNVTISGKIDSATGDFSGAVDVGGSTTAVAITASGLVTANAKIDLNGTELILDADADTSITADTDDQIDIRVAGTDQVTIKDGAISPVTDSDVDLGTTSLRYKDAFIDTVTTTGNVTVGGDLTITGDDLVMGTNTSGHILVADGANFNPVAVTDLVAIDAVADGDTLLAVDASGGGLKKIAKSALVAGLATSSALTEIVQDDSPQLGADLDTNSFNIKVDDDHGILDDDGNQQLIFQKTGSAVNQFDITNAASGSGPQLSATGDDSNITLNLLAKGTGTVVIKGNTNPGALVLNCESNSHGQTLKAQPHDPGTTNTMLLPTGANSTLVSLVSADTLTNKTLTSPIINTGTFGTSILPVSADGTVLGSASKEFSDLFLADGATIKLGNDQDVVLTHVADTGLLLNAAMVVQFRDSAINIGSPADGDLDINADDEIELNSTLVDINANVEISGTLAQADAITMATDKKVVFRDAALFINSSADGQLDLAADTEIELTATTVDVVGNFTNSGTIVSTGKITADAGIDIDNFNIDGTTIALSSGDLTVDVAGDIILNADGDDFKFQNASVNLLTITNSSSDAVIKPATDAKDIIFQQFDGTAVMTVEDNVSLTINNDVNVVGRSSGTISENTDGHCNLSLSNDHKCTPGGDLELELQNPAIGQSGNIMFINGSDHQISAHASLLIAAASLTTISASGTYLLTYYCSAASGDNTILVSASTALT